MSVATAYILIIVELSSLAMWQKHLTAMKNNTEGLTSHFKEKHTKEMFYCQAIVWGTQFALLLLVLSLFNPLFRNGVMGILLAKIFITTLYSKSKSTF